MTLVMSIGTAGALATAQPDEGVTTRMPEITSSPRSLSLVRLPDPHDRGMMAMDMMAKEFLPTYFAGVVLGGGGRSERLLAREFNPDGSSLASMRVKERRGFALVSADDEPVHLTVLGLR
jgi:hypothetical protein